MVLGFSSKKDSDEESVTEVKKRKMSLRTEFNILFLLVMVGMIFFCIMINRAFLELLASNYYFFFDFYLQYCHQ